jgi:hypothetical protein
MSGVLPILELHFPIFTSDPNHLYFVLSFWCREILQSQFYFMIEVRDLFRFKARVQVKSEAPWFNYFFFSINVPG